jgi:hypothetical protein
MVLSIEVKRPMRTTPQLIHAARKQAASSLQGNSPLRTTAGNNNSGLRSFLYSGSGTANEHGSRRGRVSSSFRRSRFNSSNAPPQVNH